MKLSPLKQDFLRSLAGIDALDTGALASALDTEPSVAIRLNARKRPAPEAAPLFGAEERVEWCADGRRLECRPVFTLSPLLHAGAFYVQDPSSMIHQQLVERIAGLLGRRPGDTPLTLLDFCAAPGGKTTAMINALPDGAVVVANEFVPSRGKILRENLEKWGYPGVITTGCSSRDYGALPAMFDIVAVDAPCSGEGMMRKDDEARRQWSQRLVEECAELQRSILADIAPLLHPGGYLIYSTCTFNLQENELNSRYIRDELGLEPVAPDSLHLLGVDCASRALLPDVEALRFMQHLTRGEGLYVSVFRRSGLPDASVPLNDVECKCHTVPGLRKASAHGKSPGNRKGGGAAQSAALRAALEEAAEWFDPGAGISLECNGSLVTALPAAAAPVAAALRRHGIRITGAGLPAAEIKGDVIVPDSRLVLSGAYRRGAFPEVELNADEALRYLRRESLALPADVARGYVVVTFEGVPLGMMKNIGNRANNMLPAPWRIKMQ